MSFSEIKLTKAEIKTLKSGISKYIYPRTNPERLIRFKLAQYEFSGEPGYMPKPTGRIQATDKGRDYIQYYRISFRERWLPYWITTGVSILALIIAGIALLAELDLIHLPRP